MSLTHQYGTRYASLPTQGRNLDHYPLPVMLQTWVRTHLKVAKIKAKRSHDSTILAFEEGLKDMKRSYCSGSEPRSCDCAASDRMATGHVNANRADTQRSFIRDLPAGSLRTNGVERTKGGHGQLQFIDMSVSILAKGQQAQAASEKGTSNNDASRKKLKPSGDDDDDKQSPTQVNGQGDSNTAALPGFAHRL